MKKAIKEVSTIPTAKMSMPMKSINCENSEVIPSLNRFVADVRPMPKLLLNSSKNSVEATLKAKVTMVKPV
jgi:hypothetical protein